MREHEERALVRYGRGQAANDTAVVVTRSTEHLAPLTVETVEPWEPATWR